VASCILAGIAYFRLVPVIAAATIAVLVNGVAKERASVLQPKECDTTRQD
jgi:hypothetical protein